MSQATGVLLFATDSLQLHPALHPQRWYVSLRPCLSCVQFEALPAAVAWKLRLAKKGSKKAVPTPPVMPNAEVVWLDMKRSLTRGTVRASIVFVFSSWAPQHVFL